MRKWLRPATASQLGCIIRNRTADSRLTLSDSCAELETGHIDWARSPMGADGADEHAHRPVPGCPRLPREGWQVGAAVCSSRSHALKAGEVGHRLCGLSPARDHETLMAAAAIHEAPSSTIFSRSHPEDGACALAGRRRWWWRSRGKPAASVATPDTDAAEKLLPAKLHAANASRAHTLPSGAWSDLRDADATEQTRGLGPRPAGPAPAARLAAQARHRRAAGSRR